MMMDDKPLGLSSADVGSTVNVRMPRCVDGDMGLSFQ